MNMEPCPLCGMTHEPELPHDPTTMEGKKMGRPKKPATEHAKRVMVSMAPDVEAPGANPWDVLTITTFERVPAGGEVA